MKIDSESFMVYPLEGNKLDFENQNATSFLTEMNNNLYPSSRVSHIGDILLLSNLLLLLVWFLNLIFLIHTSYYSLTKKLSILYDSL